MNVSRMLRSLLPRELRLPPNPGKRVLAGLGYSRFRTRIAAEGAPVPDLDLYRHVESLVTSTGAAVKLHVGFIPDTFSQTRIDRLAFAHIDVDLFQTVLDCVEFVYPRLIPGGIMVFDDYRFPGCVRAREATDKAFLNFREKPIYLPTGQAMVIKLTCNADSA